MTTPVLTIPWQVGDDPAFLRSREWLVTNGLGGYASGTLLGIPTRRYHGVFIPNLHAPRGRTVLIPQLDEVVQYDSQCAHLGGAEFADGRAGEGETQRFLSEFRHEWQTPVWVFSMAGHILEKRIIMPYGEDTVYISYRLVRGHGPVQLQLRPYVVFRRHDDLLDNPAAEGPFPLMILGGRYEVHFGEGLPALKLCLRPHCGTFVAEDKVSGNVLYRVERGRGYDHTATLRSPGYFTTTLEPEKPVALVASVAPWETLDLDYPRFLQRSSGGWRKCCPWPRNAHVPAWPRSWSLPPTSSSSFPAVVRKSGCWPTPPVRKSARWWPGITGSPIGVVTP